jgi:hypothetical protein
MVATAMSEIVNRTGNEPWLSLESASWWFDKSSVVLAVSLLIGFVCTVIIIVTGTIKEHHWDLARERANERIALVNEETVRLSVEAETARKETAQAKLELQQIRFPRRLDSDKLKAGIAEVPPQFFEVLYDQSAADGSSLAFEIFVTLVSIGWRTDQKLPAPLTPQLGPPNLRDVYQLLPLTRQAGASAWGVSVVTKGPISEDPKMPERILGNALLNSVASPLQMVGRGKDETMPAGKIRVIVSPKLP